MKKKLLKGLVVSSLLCASLLTGCSSSNDQVVIYSNADDEAVTAMKNALDKNGYEGQYLFQTFGTSELGGLQYHFFYCYKSCLISIYPYISRVSAFFLHF